MGTHHSPRRSHAMFCCRRCCPAALAAFPLVLLLAGTSAAQAPRPPAGKEPTEQQKALAELKKLNAVIRVDAKKPGKPVTEALVYNDASLPHLKAFPQLEWVALAGEVSDEGL